jgi:hypothetical protein
MSYETKFFNPYARATGYLQGTSQMVAIEIEAVVRAFPMDEFAKARLTETAQKLRGAVDYSEALLAPEEAA